MTKNEQTEIRTVLLGRTLLLEDGRIASRTGDDFRMFNGVADGAGAVHFLGLSRRFRQLESDFDEARTLELARGRMAGLGRGLYLRTRPEAAACLIRYVLTKPVALVFCYDGGAPVLSAWTGRGPTAPIALGRAVKAFCRGLPPGLRPAGEAVPPGQGPGSAGDHKEEPHS